MGKRPEAAEKKAEAAAALQEGAAPVSSALLSRGLFRRIVDFRPPAPLSVHLAGADFRPPAPISVHLDGAVLRGRPGSKLARLLVAACELDEERRRARSAEEREEELALSLLLLLRASPPPRTGAVHRR